VLRAARFIDLADVVALLRANRDALDTDHLFKWLRHFQLQRRFRECWKEAFPTEVSPL
jgi:hypothetical protein